MRRLLQGGAVLVGVTVIAFALLHLAPGGPLAMYTLTTSMGAEDLARISHELGLDQPLPVQYARWAANLVHGDWGRSYRDSRPVLVDIADRLPGTVELMLASLLLAIGIGVAVGILGALRRYSIFDYLATTGALVPLLTLAGVQLPMLFGGALVTETVFSWPGMGRFFVDSLGYRDYPVLMGILIFTAILVILGNLLADLLYAVVDPRIRFG